MTMNLRWDPCVLQDADEFEDFLHVEINQPQRHCLLIGGAGFDPRATIVPAIFAKLDNCTITGIFFREERTMQQTGLRDRADKTQKRIQELIQTVQFPAIEIFAGGVTAVGGRRAIEYLKDVKFSQFTNIFVDISALSSSVFFPIVSFLVDISDQRRSIPLNLHLVTAEQPSLDHGIRGIPADSAAMMHGFKGQRSLDSTEEEAMLWIPILAPGHDECLRKIFEHIQRKDVPIDVCPLVPFPGGDPRMTDRLIADYRMHIASWRADQRNFLYAAESDPLDSYRAISALHSERQRLFSKLGGSQVILSPLGNKMLSVGAMLAAIEKQLPVVMVESIGYDEGVAIPTPSSVPPQILKHVWLCGEAYGV